MSGDVHYGQFFSSKCSSYTGYKIHELCSSGLTHVLSEASPKVEIFIEGHTPKFFKVTIYFFTSFILGNRNLYGS